MIGSRMKFGIFMAPFHRIGENPTLALHRDMELIQWLDHLGFDEAWIGEHHSAGWELISAPELIIAAAAERTKHIKLGSGVTSLPYHHPLMVVNRFVQLDHMTRGRAMLGCGPGALVSDAYMMGIAAETQRRRMDESLGAIMALLAGDEPVTMETDWFQLKDARLHLRPFTEPHFPIAVASTLSPAGMMSAGKHGVGVLSLGAGSPGGLEGLAKHWGIAEESAAEAGRTMNRADWRVVVTMHLAEDAEQAVREVHAGERRESVTYFEETLGRPPGRAEDPLRAGIKAGTTLIGTPETAIAGIERLIEHCKGGFGAVLFRAHEWANRESTLRSYELFARYVMPHFQNQLASIRESNDWARANRRTVFAPNVQAMAQAYIDAGRPVPSELQTRLAAFDTVTVKAD